MTTVHDDIDALLSSIEHDCTSGDQFDNALCRTMIENYLKGKKPAVDPGIEAMRQEGITTTELGLPPKGTNLNQWINERISMVERIEYTAGGDPDRGYVWSEDAAEIARGACLALIADVDTIIKNLTAHGYKIMAPGKSFGLLSAVMDVAQFHKATGVPVLEEPQWPSEARIELRTRLDMEEHHEYYDALAARDLVEFADAITDRIYILIGTALEHGIPLDLCWDEVQRSNMTKVDPVTGKANVREDGKILKPPSFSPANLAQFFPVEN